MGSPRPALHAETVTHEANGPTDTLLAWALWENPRLVDWLPGLLQGENPGLALQTWSDLLA